MKTGITVLGVPRSGTSLITELVHRWGAYVGKKLLAADKRNERGFWELVQLKQFNTDVLTSIGASKDFPPDDNGDILLANRAVESSYTQRAAQLINDMERESEIWVWKDPKMSILLPFWKQILKNNVYIISVRNPWDIILSYKKLEGNLFTDETFPWNSVLLHWHIYTWKIVQHTNNIQKKLFLSYEQILQNPLLECEKLSRFLEAQCNTAPNRYRINQMIQVITPELQHNKTITPFDDIHLATDIQKALYRFLQQKVIDPDLPIPAGLAPPSNWKAILISENERIKYTK
jgi:hypothetical protein